MANVSFEKIERQMKYIVLPLFRQYSTKIEFMMPTLPFILTEWHSKKSHDLAFEIEHKNLKRYHTINQKGSN